MPNNPDVREFLSSRRARLAPDKAGLPAYGGHRRVPGLRREEVALLAGVSVDYYTRLERGNLSGVSAAVLESLARALQLGLQRLEAGFEAGAGGGKTLLEQALHFLEAPIAQRLREASGVDVAAVRDAIHRMNGDIVRVPGQADRDAAIGLAHPIVDDADQFLIILRGGNRLHGLLCPGGLQYPL